MWGWVAQLVVSVLISRITRPKSPKSTPGEVRAPVAEEGHKIRKIYGTVWIDDPQVLGFKTIGTDRIQSKGGKK